MYLKSKSLGIFIHCPDLSIYRNPSFVESYTKEKVTNYCQTSKKLFIMTLLFLFAFLNSIKKNSLSYLLLPLTFLLKKKIKDKIYEYVGVLTFMHINRIFII